MARGKKRKYTQAHARAGVNTHLPALETWENQYPGYEITIRIPEYTSVCPRTGLPDFGTITLHYMPDKHCLELKSLKQYINAYRNLGIFYENAVNRVLRDLVAACRPVWAVVRGEFSVRGGMSTTVEACYTPRRRQARRGSDMQLYNRPDARGSESCAGWGRYGSRPKHRTV